MTNYAYSGVKPTALTAQCSERLATLARPKNKPTNYINAILPKTVSEQALPLHRSDRISNLAKPRHNIILINSAWKNKQN